MGLMDWIRNPNVAPQAFAAMADASARPGYNPILEFAIAGQQGNAQWQLQEEARRKLEEEEERRRAKEELEAEYLRQQRERDEQLFMLEVIQSGMDPAMRDAVRASGLPVPEGAEQTWYNTDRAADDRAFEDAGAANYEAEQLQAALQREIDDREDRQRHDLQRDALRYGDVGGRGGGGESLSRADALKVYKALQAGEITQEQADLLLGGGEGGDTGPHEELRAWERLQVIADGAGLTPQKIDSLDAKGAQETFNEIVGILTEEGFSQQSAETAARRLVLPPADGQAPPAAPEQSGFMDKVENAGRWFGIEPLSGVRRVETYPRYGSDELSPEPTEMMELLKVIFPERVQRPSLGHEGISYLSPDNIGPEFPGTTMPEGENPLLREIKMQRRRAMGLQPWQVEWR